jgi:hypothetical protein
MDPPSPVPYVADGHMLDMVFDEASRAPTASV